MIYVIGEEGTGYVKIGTADDPGSRLRELQCGNPRHLELLAAIPGTYGEERRLHRRFSRLRTVGEWFDFTDRDAATEVVTAALALAAEPAPADEPPMIGDVVTAQLGRWTDADTARLLETLPAMFDDDTEKLSTRDLLSRLFRQGAWSFTSPQAGGKVVAQALADVGLAPRALWIDGRTRKGYARADVERVLSALHPET